MEATRLSDSLHGVMEQVAREGHPDLPSDLFLRLSSYCGVYSGLSGKRFDLTSTLQPFGFDFSDDGDLTSPDFGSLVYNVYPQLLNFSEPTQDLKVWQAFNCKYSNLET